MNKDEILLTIVLYTLVILISSSRVMIGQISSYYAGRTASIGTDRLFSRTTKLTSHFEKKHVQSDRSVEKPSINGTLFKGAVNTARKKPSAERTSNG